MDFERRRYSRNKTTQEFTLRLSLKKINFHAHTLTVCVWCMLWQMIAYHHFAHTSKLKFIHVDRFGRIKCFKKNSTKREESLNIFKMMLNWYSTDKICAKMCCFWIIFQLSSSALSRVKSLLLEDYGTFFVLQDNTYFDGQDNLNRTYIAHNYVVLGGTFWLVEQKHIFGMFISQKITFFFFLRRCCLL